jgi:hypothetical protein
MQPRDSRQAHWWCASDLYTEHGCPPAGKGFEWIPHENYSGGMPRSEFTGANNSQGRQCHSTLALTVIA